MPSEDCERLLVAGRRKRVQARHELLHRVVPGDRVVLGLATIAASLQRLRDAVRVIRDLNRRLTARAQPAVVHRMLGGAFEFLGGMNANETRLSVPDDVGVRHHHANAEAAAGRAERAHARLHRGNARHDVFVRHEADDFVLGTTAARQSSAGPGDGSELDEGAAIHYRRTL